ncbi:hypothetical protein C9374_011591 [Naegleria lovaniensis]|uniref:DNA polymerase delta subunit 3 n=1 Tax=Naegleria lovaniensis TaxID=51637 RepID=A0AA88KFB0_NAELO|nr:uncharacterized protein C9374_011591 [Naegleria lovaniensis]KAG2373926.1 hypothetical protein C9374_011591 [Naegleria lovaniensis]
MTKSTTSGVMTISKDKYFKILEDELEEGTRTMRVVDYKWLSMKCSVDVNQAKQMLYEYYSEDSNSNSLHVTYLLAGQPKDHSLPYQIALVSMNQLEQVKTSFEKINSIHIYSISRTRPSTISDLYRLDSNTHFPYRECGILEYGGGTIEMKSKVKNQSANLEIAEPAMKGLQPKKELTNSSHNDENTSSPKKEQASSSSKKSPSDFFKKSTKRSTPQKAKHELSEDDDEEMKDAHLKKNSSLILDEESDGDEPMKTEMSEDEQDTQSKKKKNTKKSPSSSNKKSSKKTTPSKTQTNTLDKFTSQSPKSTTTMDSSSEKKLTKRVKQTVQVKNEKGYLVSTDIWTEVPLTEEEIKQMEKKQQVSSAINVKKELSSDDENAMQDEEDSSKKKQKTKKESTSTSKSNKSVVSANPHSGPKQTSIGSFFKKK